jgi:bacillithiol synthase
MIQRQANLYDINILTPLISDYLAGSEKLKSFYGFSPEIENFQQQIEAKEFSTDKRKVLTAVLQHQYSSLNKSETIIHNIQSLMNENTFTVTTAHQTNIFTGPLYYIYKIAHVIKLAESLKQHYPSYHFVPVYWMGCEDHDFDEVNHIYLFGEKTDWLDRQGGAVGRHHPKTLTELLIPIKNKLSNEPYTEPILSIFEKGYAGFETLASATQYIVNELFGKYGLVIINPDTHRLKKLFAPVIKDELLHQPVTENANLTIGKLNSLGYKIQAQPRDINLFYIDGNIRERIVWNYKSNQFEILNTSLQFSKENLLMLVENEPEKFSPNVFLRPLYQETVLPNLAYVGGAGELSYWLEQKEIFSHFKTDFPILMLRNSFTFIDSSAEKKITKLNVSVTDFFRDEDVVIRNYLADNNNLPDFEKEKKELERIFTEIKLKAENIDTTLKAAVEAQLQQTINNLETLEKKLTRAIKQQHDTAINQIHSVRNRLMPGNKLQERYENFIPLAASKGLEVLDDIVNTVQPFDPLMHFMK